MPSPNTIASIALAICITGLLWRMRRWLHSPIGPENDGLSFGRRLGAALQAFGKVLCSRHIYRITASFLWETLFLGHLLQAPSVALGRPHGRLLRFFSIGGLPCPG